MRDRNYEGNTMLLKIASPALALLLCSATALEAGEQPQKWGTWLDGGAFYNNKDEARGESTLWVPFMQSPTSVFFGEARGKLFEESQQEGNFALGFRHMYGDGWNLGLWGGYDIRSTESGSTFHQVAGGLEALSKNWDFRINGYVPLNDSNDLGSYSFSTGGAPTILLSGSSILMQTGINSVTSTQVEYAMGGIDAEVGMRLPVEALKLDPDKLDLRVYAGGFYFDNDEADKAIVGPKLRAELRFNDVIAAAPGSAAHARNRIHLRRRARRSPGSGRPFPYSARRQPEFCLAQRAGAAHVGGADGATRMSCRAPKRPRRQSTRSRRRPSTTRQRMCSSTRWRSSTDRSQAA